MSVKGQLSETTGAVAKKTEGSEVVEHPLGISKRYSRDTIAIINLPYIRSRQRKRGVVLKPRIGSLEKFKGHKWRLPSQSRKPIKRM